MDALVLGRFKRFTGPETRLGAEEMHGVVDHFRLKSS